MRVNLFMLLISLIVGGLIFYGFYSALDGDLLFSLVPALLGIVTLAVSLSFRRKESPRTSVMVKVGSGMFFIVILVANVFLAWFRVTDAAFVVTNGIGLCLWAVTIYSVGRTRE